MSEEWSPGDHKGNAKPQKEFNDTPVPSGVYVVGGTWMEKPPGKNFVKLRFEILHGPLKGASIFPIMPTNVREKQGSANKVYHFMLAMGREDVSVNFSKEVSIKKAFLGAGLKVKVKTSKRLYNGKTYTDHDLVKFAALAQQSDEEKEVIAAWNEEKAEFDYGGDDSADFDDDFGGGGDSGGFDDFPADDFGDDEIPF